MDRASPSCSDVEDVSSWTIVTNVALTSSPFIFVDLNASASKRFYRAFPQQISPTFDSDKLVWIRPGTFIMGSPITEKDRWTDESPQTQVTITKGFWMSKHEVTQKEYFTIMGVNPSFFKDDMNMPVQSIYWNDATNYCGKLTQKERLAGRLPEGYLSRLPTEAEWEYCCRAGTTTRFCYGDDLNLLALENYAWYEKNSGGKPHPVGQKLPNAWGLYDMHGNVSEICFEHYGPYPGGNVTDPKGASSGLTGILRGGGIMHNGWFCRSADRGSTAPGYGTYDEGFRVVLAPIK